jgi:hypothetical protein
MSKSALSEAEEFEVQPILCIAGVLVISALAGALPVTCDYTVPTSSEHTFFLQP